MNAPVDVSFFARAAKPITSYRKYWAHRFGPAPFLPMNRQEMEALGWDSCDVVLVTGDAYVDHPSFGMAVIGRVLEAQGFRVGILAQPDWHSAEPFKALGKPNLFWGVTAGNMDSMINRYTADRKLRSDDAYTPGDVGGRRPDRAAIVYSQRCREAFKEVPIVLGGIEGSLRRIAHYDYWSEKVRHSIVLDAKCDLLLYGNAERAIVEIAHRLAANEPVTRITDVRGTAFVRRETPAGWFEIDSTSVDAPGRVEDHINPYLTIADQAKAQGETCSKEQSASVSTSPSSSPTARAELVEALVPASTSSARTVGVAARTVGVAARTVGATARTVGDSAGTVGQAVGDALRTVGDAPGTVGDASGTVGDAPGRVGNAHRTVGTAPGAAGDASGTVGDAPGRVGNAHRTVGTAARTAGDAAGDAARTVVGATPGQRIPIQFFPNPKVKLKPPPRDHTVIRIPAYEAVKSDPVLYAHANRVLHLETNPGNARALVQAHGERDVWLTPPPIPLTTAEMDYVFGLPYARAPHPAYGKAKIPAWEMIRFSVNIMRGCFGGCTFCSITEHEGRIIQSRSEASILQEVEDIRDKVEGFTGVISDLGGPTANMYRIGCKTAEIEAACRKPSCVYPGICQNLNTDHGPLIKIYRRARELKGIKKVLIGSGLRYDLAVESPEYVKELVQHHVGGYLKIAPEHTEGGPLSKMMKPGIGSYDRFKTMFDKYSEEVGKKQYLIPYFIAAHPGTSDEDMMNLAIWLKRNGFRADQVQTFYPSPMATATAMYHSGRNTLRKVTRQSEGVDIVRGEKRRRLHKAFLRYHDANNWPLLREALKAMGRADLIGNGKHHLIPTWQPLTDGAYASPRRKNSTAVAPQQGRLLTQHTGLPPRVTGAAKPPRKIR